jgi:NTE family protein
MFYSNPLKKSRANKIQANSYEEWSEKAQALDFERGGKSWREKEESDLYGYGSIRKRLDTLRRFRAEGDDHAVLFNLNEGIHGNMDGIANGKLYQRSAFGTKHLIEEYVHEIDDALQHIAETDDTQIDREEKRAFFIRALRCYGQSAFLMSGSGVFLFFHLGVAKAMWLEGLLPRIISGSSGGSVVGAMLCTHTDAKLPNYFDAAWLYDLSERHGNNGKDGEFITQEQGRRQLEHLIPDLTFQEAYELTGRYLNISIAPAEKHQKSRLLNAIASPNVMIREAVQASCAVPGIYEPIALMAKDHTGKRVPYLEDRRWVDGSVTSDLPTKRLARLFGVNHHIVSQANPMVTPFISDTKQPDSPLASIHQASVATYKAWANANYAIFEKPLSLVPQLNAAVTMGMSMLDQEYVGDITIINPVQFASLAKGLSQLSRKEMTDLVKSGEQETWPKLEMIKNQTIISRTLTEITHKFRN